MGNENRMDGSGGSPSKVMIMQLSGLLNTAGEGVTGVGVVYGVHLLSGYMKGIIESIPWLLRAADSSTQQSQAVSISTGGGSSSADAVDASSDDDKSVSAGLEAVPYVVVTEFKKVVMIGLVIAGGIVLKRGGARLRSADFLKSADSAI